jgi:hypothetical protein
MDLGGCEKNEDHQQPNPQPKAEAFRKLAEGLSIPL